MLNALKHSSITVKQNDTLSAAGTRRESLRDYSLLENHGFLRLHFATKVFCMQQTSTQ